MIYNLPNDYTTFTEAVDAFLERGWVGRGYRGPKIELRSRGGSEGPLYAFCEAFEAHVKGPYRQTQQKEFGRKDYVYEFYSVTLNGKKAQYVLDRIWAYIPYDHHHRARALKAFYTPPYTEHDLMIHNWGRLLFHPAHPRHPYHQEYLADQVPYVPERLGPPTSSSSKPSSAPTSASASAPASAHNLDAELSSLVSPPSPGPHGE